MRFDILMSKRFSICRASLQVTYCARAVADGYQNEWAVKRIVRSESRERIGLAPYNGTCRRRLIWPEKKRSGFLFIEKISVELSPNVTLTQIELMSPESTVLNIRYQLILASSGTKNASINSNCKLPTLSLESGISLSEVLNLLLRSSLPRIHTRQFFIFIITDLIYFSSFSIPNVIHIIEFVLVRRTDMSRVPAIFRLIYAHRLSQPHMRDRPQYSLNFILRFFSSNTAVRRSTNGTQLNFAAGSEVRQTTRSQHCCCNLVWLLVHFLLNVVQSYSNLFVQFC